MRQSRAKAHGIKTKKVEDTMQKKTAGRLEKKPNKWTTQTDRRPGEVYATVVWKCDQREKGDMRAIREAIWVTFFFSQRPN